MRKNIAVIQSLVPHYRLEFFNILKEHVDSCSVYTYAPIEKYAKNSNLQKRDFIIPIKSILLKGFWIYSPWKLLNKKHNIIVAYLNFSHIVSWFLLLTKVFHKKKIILWGHGISVKRYLKEEKHPDWKLKLMIRLADGVWLYMDKETKLWKKHFPNKPIVSLDNTLSGTEEMVSYTPNLSKTELKIKYGIKESTILIFCARFESNNRRTDLLIDVITRLDNKKFGFIIIGSGCDKPDFSSFANVYDFGALYETSVKQELFFIADIYFQPGWCGLSIVEAMAYGKPIFTFARTEYIKQCVEYSYIKDGINGKTFKDIEDCTNYLETISTDVILHMGEKSRNLVREKLLPNMMVNKALSIL